MIFIRNMTTEKGNYRETILFASKSLYSVKNFLQWLLPVNILHQIDVTAAIQIFAK